MNLLKNTGYHIPILGVIRTGGVAQTAAGLVAYQNDFFRLTQNFKQGGDWVPHPLQESLLDNLPRKANGRLSEIKVRVVFANPDLNMSERFECYHPDTKRLLCAGNGSNAQRMDPNGLRSDVTCAGPDNCSFGRDHQCRLMVRSIFRVEGQDDENSAFMLRSSGFNTMTTLRTKLEMLAVKYGQAIRHLPLKLVLRAKSTVLSEDQVFYYPDLVVDGSEEDAVALAQARLKREKDRGVDYSILEKRVSEMKGNDSFRLWNDETVDADSHGIDSGVDATAQEVAPTLVQIQNETNLRTGGTSFKLTLTQPIPDETDVGESKQGPKLALVHSEPQAPEDKVVTIPNRQTITYEKVSTSVSNQEFPLDRVAIGLNIATPTQMF